MGGGGSAERSTSLFGEPPVINRPPAIENPTIQPTVGSLFDVDQVVGQPVGPPRTPRHTGIKAMVKGLGTDVKHLPSRQNLFLVGVGSGLALAAHPFDDNLNLFLVDNKTADHIFKLGEVLGESPTLLGAASIVYAVGRLKDQPKVSHVGMDLLRSLLIAEGLTRR